MKQILILCMLLSLFSMHGDTITYTPTPSWVKTLPVPEYKGEPEAGISYLLFQREEYVKKQASYGRLTYKLTSPQGVENNSIVKINFNPEYQTLNIHSIQVIRDGTVIFVPDEVWYLQQENQLEYLMYNGTKSAHIILEGVESGDIIDYSYTIIGHNPVFNSYFSDYFDFSWQNEVQKVFYRVFSPKKLSILNRGHEVAAVESTSDNGQYTYSWELEDTDSVLYEDQAPSWYPQYAYTIVSHFSSWQQLVNWALPYYQHEENSFLRDLSNEICRGIEDEAVKVEKLLDYVQNNIRYLGLEIGVQSHAPSSSKKTALRKFGDCKDKTMLFISLLQAQNIEAYPMFVNTTSGKLLNSTQPSPLAFNHVIASVNLSEDTYYLDPTNNAQKGSIINRGVQNYEYGLEVFQGNDQLVEIKSSNLPKTEIRMDFDLRQAEPTLTITTTRYQTATESDRSYFNYYGIENSGINYLNYYAEDYPEISRSAEVEFVDHGEKTIVKDYYTLPQAGETFTFWPTDIYNEFSLPYFRNRTTPLSIGNKRNVTLYMNIKLPETIWDIDDESEKINRSAYQFFKDLKYVSHKKELNVTYNLKIEDDTLEKDEVAAYIEDVNQIYNTAAVVLNMPGSYSGSSADSENEDAGSLFLSVIGIALVIIVVRHFIKKRSQL